MTDERRTLARLSLSKPTVWPIAVAVSAAIAVVGLFIHVGVLALGLALALVSLAGWAAEDYRRYVLAPARRTGPFVRVAAKADIPENQVRWFRVEGMEVCVANVDGDYFAVGNRCPHMFARLGKGRLIGTLVECPWHGARYDVTDGGLACWVQRPWWLKLIYDLSLPGFMKRGVPAYEVEVRGDDIYIQVA